MDQSYPCQYCQTTFLHSQQLEQHQITCPFKHFKCLNCHQQIPYSDYENHLCQPQDLDIIRTMSLNFHSFVSNAANTVEKFAISGFGFLHGLTNQTMSVLGSVVNEITHQTEEPRRSIRDMVEGWEQRARQVVRERQQRQQTENLREEYEDLRASTLPNFKYRESTNLGEENRKCAICQVEFCEMEKINILPCLHRFHQECISDWFRNKRNCPVCRTEY